MQQQEQLGTNTNVNDNYARMQMNQYANSNTVAVPMNYNRYVQPFGNFGEPSSAPEATSYLASTLNANAGDYTQTNQYYREQNQRYSIDQAFPEQPGFALNRSNSIDHGYGSTTAINEQLYANVASEAAQTAAINAATAFALQQQQKQASNSTGMVQIGHLDGQQKQQKQQQQYGGNNNVNYNSSKQQGLARVPSELTSTTSSSRNTHIDLPLDILDEPKSQLSDFE